MIYHCYKGSVVFWLKRLSKPLPTETVSATQQEFQHKDGCIIINTSPAQGNKGNKKSKRQREKEQNKHERVIITGSVGKKGQAC